MTAAAYQLLTVCALIDASLTLLVITLHDGLSYESGCCQPIVVYCFHILVLLVVTLHTLRAFFRSDLA